MLTTEQAKILLHEINKLQVAAEWDAKEAISLKLKGKHEGMALAYSNCIFLINEKLYGGDNANT